MALHMENARFSLETNCLLNVSNYTCVCDMIQFVQITVTIVNTN